jgi:hypothetical protein
MISDTQKNLQAARDVITPPRSWIAGYRKLHVGPNVVAHCALGSLDEVHKDIPFYYADSGCPEVQVLAEAIPADFVSRHEKFPLWAAHRVAEYNNAHDQDTVLAWFDRAIERQRLIDAMAEVPAAPEKVLEKA